MLLYPPLEVPGSHPQMHSHSNSLRPALRAYTLSVWYPPPPPPAPLPASQVRVSKTLFCAAMQYSCCFTSAAHAPTRQSAIVASPVQYICPFPHVRIGLVHTSSRALRLSQFLIATGARPQLASFCAAPSALHCRSPALLVLAPFQASCERWSGNSCPHAPALSRGALTRCGRGRCARSSRPARTRRRRWTTSPATRARCPAALPST